MTQLTKLTGTTVDAPWNEPRGVINSLHLEPVKGFFLRAQLGAAGFTLRSTTGAAVGIPLAELVRLCQEADAKLLPPPTKS